MRQVLVILSLLVAAGDGPLVQGPASGPAQAPEPRPAAGRKAWVFAVSGDSRDCGDLVMPKIAASMAAVSKTTPVAFYWHLGDFRNGRTVDRDYGVLNGDDDDYHELAWDDFLSRQVAPIEAVTQVFLGVGNHELIFPWWSHEEYEEKFGRFLLQEPVGGQRVLDRKAGLVRDRHHLDYHFVKNGIDFISLDNSDTYAFSPAYLLHPAFTSEQVGEVGRDDPPGARNEAEGGLAEYCYTMNTEPEHHMRQVDCGEKKKR